MPQELDCGFPKAPLRSRPSGWHAQRPEESEAVILLSEAGDGFIMVFKMLNLTEEALIALLGERQPITHDLVFEPSGPVTKQIG